MFREEVLKELQEKVEEYEVELSKYKEEYHTMSGIPVKRLYTPLDIAGQDYMRDIGFPGHYPFTRGGFAAGFVSRPWNLRQVIGLGNAEETNQRIKYLLSKGQTALGIVGAVKSGMGRYNFDTDDERTIGFAGKDGVQLDTLLDYEIMLDGVDISKISIHLITSSAIALAMYIAVAEKRGIPLDQLKGSMSNVVRPSKECWDIIEFCARNMPQFNATYIDVRNIREAGCTAPQEIGFGVAFGIEAVRQMRERGVDIDEFAPRISWFVNAGPEFFEEVAKFRAMRRLWAKTMKELGAKDPRSMRLRAHVQTYAPTLTYQQPLNNIIRSTIYALAAVLGGAQSLSVNSFDEALAIPTELSATLSLRTQQIIYFETGVAEVVDPLAGSYYVEWLTDRLEEEAQKIVEAIEARGGAFKAYDWMQEQVREAAYRYQQEVESGKRIWVGVNAFVEEDDPQLRMVLSQSIPIYKYDPTLRERQIERLNKVKRERDQARAEAAKQGLYEALKKGENIMPALIEAAKAYLSHGEIAQICCQFWGQQESYTYFCG